jgi:type IV secretion system protein VirB11
MNMMSPVAGPVSANNVNVYLNSYLAPFTPWLEAGDVTEILVNMPGEVWVERMGAAQMERHLAPAIDAQLLERLAHQIARINHQGVSRETPLLAAVLPGGARVQMILPPATRGAIALAIRKHVLHDLTLDAYYKGGGFSTFGQQDIAAPDRHYRLPPRRNRSAQDHPAVGRHIVGQDDVAECDAQGNSGA